MFVQKEVGFAFNELILACPENLENALGLPKKNEALLFAKKVKKDVY